MDVATRTFHERYMAVNSICQTIVRFNKKPSGLEDLFCTEAYRCHTNIFCSIFHQEINIKSRELNIKLRDINIKLMEDKRINSGR